MQREGRPLTPQHQAQEVGTALKKPHPPGLSPLPGVQAPSPPQSLQQDGPSSPPPPSPCSCNPARAAWGRGGLQGGEAQASLESRANPWHIILLKY